MASRGPLRGAASIRPKAGAPDARLPCTNNRDSVLEFAATMASTHPTTVRGVTVYKPELSAFSASSQIVALYTHNKGDLCTNSR